MMAHCYSHLYGLPATGLRFFTVYGPWGRPDMALFLFTRNILAGRPIDVFNRGRHRRDFTYIDDVVEGIVRGDRSARGPGRALARGGARPGHQRPRRTGSTTSATAMASNWSAASGCWRCAWAARRRRTSCPCSPATCPDTLADVGDLAKDFGYRPNTPVEVGVRRFVDWYKAFYGVCLRGRGAVSGEASPPR